MKPFSFNKSLILFDINIDPSKLFSVIGLTLDIFGALLIFYFGIQPALNKPAHKFTLGTFTEEDIKYKNHKRLSKLGLAFLIIGFCFQIIGVIL